MLLVACGAPPPGAAPAPPAPAPVAKAPPIDLSPAPEPPGLIAIARVNKPDAILGAAGAWTKLPIPNGAELLKGLGDDALAATVDLSQPVDGAISASLARKGVDVTYAVAVAVKSFDQAKASLAAKHRLVEGENGSFKIPGLGSKKRPQREESQKDDDEDDDDRGCELAHAAPGAGAPARLVCGEMAGLAALTPFLTRTMPREKWPADVHLEVRPGPVRAPLAELRSQLPILARGLMGGSASPSVRDFIDASLGELVDIVNDTHKLSIDAQIADSGIVATTRFEMEGTKSVFARMITASDRADAPPPAFWHLPGDTDSAFFGRGSDPKLFDRPRELLSNLLHEATEANGMPDAERKAFKDLIGDRMLSLFTTGTGVYGKGFDQAAVEKAFKAAGASKPGDLAAGSEAKRALAEQVIGWHLYQSSEPIAKVGPVLKDWASIWSRPAFAKWAQTKSDKVPRMRLAPLPAAVVLPKETVHLEVTIPREDLEAEPVPTPAPASAPGARPNDAKAPKPAPVAAKPKKVPQKPIVFHVFAVPDGGATWLAFGLDAKLVAQKASQSLASAPETGTLGKTAGKDVQLEGKLNSGAIATLRGFAAFTALDFKDERSPFTLLGTLPNKGATPIVFTGRAEAPSGAAKSGTAVGSLRIPRGVIEDIVRLAMTSR